MTARIVRSKKSVLKREKKMIVIYDKETMRVIVSEHEGNWVLPSTWEIVELPEDEEVFHGDENGDVYIKPEAIPTGRKLS